MVDVADVKAKNTVLKRGGIAAVAIASILGSIYVAEGGYVNDPRDRGGATNYGVTQQVARENGYLGDMRWFPKHCNATLTVCADGVYTKWYVTKPGFTAWLTMDPAVAREIIDTGANMGIGVSSRFLQSAINANCQAAKVVVDGKVGPRTELAYANCQAAIGAVAFCNRMLTTLDAYQEARYRAIVKRRPSQKAFLKGWLSHRIGNVNRAECAA